MMRELRLRRRRSRVPWVYVVYTPPADRRAVKARPTPCGPADL